MKNDIVIVAVVQIILAGVFMYYANQIDPGVAKISRKFAESCGKAEQIVNSHKAIYEKSAGNIVSLQNALDGTGKKTEITSGKCRKWGEWLQTPPGGKIKKMIWPAQTAKSLGDSMVDMSNHLNDVSNALFLQSKILKEYGENVLPRTREGFDSAADSLRKTKGFLENLEQESRNNVRMVSILAGIIFLLNGVTFLVVASALPAARTKEC